MQNLERLQRKIEEDFNLDELEDLAFSVDVKWDDIPGQRLKDKARELILQMQRRKGLPRLIEALQAERPHTNWLEGTPGDIPCPYRGLHAFREEDEYLFFGRSALTGRLVTTAKEQNFVTVLGPSGSGKSSIVMAGLLPRLRQENRWLVATFRPGAQPFRALALSLLPLLYLHHSKLDLMDEEEKLVDRLRHKPGSLQQVIEWILREQEPDTKLLLIADQFEELYTLCQDRNLRHAFLDQLLAAIATANAATRPSHLLLLTLRSDFLGQFQNDHAPFVEALQTGTVFMQPMDRDGLRQAIKYPALNAGVEFDGTLVEHILGDVAQQPGQLPLLEFALSLLWEQRGNGTISHTAYEAIGRVKGALAQYADEIYAQLTAAKQKQARFIFLKLVQPGEGTEDTRRVAHKDEIGEGHWPLVTQLADARLIVTGQNEAGEETVEVIHEALIWGWQQLQVWISDDRQFLTWHKQLRNAYQQWQDNGKAEGDLLRGTLLQQASTWLTERGTNLSNQEKQFIQTSISIGERYQFGLRIGKIFRGEAQGQNFSQILITDTVFPKKVNLARTIFRNADLRRSNLNGADFRHAVLSEALLNNANLSETEMSEADLSRADLREADLSWAILSGAILNGAILSDTKLNDSNLFGASLSGADLRGADLSGADLGGADLSGADLRWANLRGAKIDKATNIDDKWRIVWEIVNHGATGRNLRGTDLSEADLRRADLYRAGLSNADLRGADLRWTDLGGADLNEADLSKAKYSAKTKWPKRFDAQKTNAIFVE